MSKDEGVDVIVGLQWGDEGKGRIVDERAGRYDIIARFGGGDNAGHSIVVGDKKLALRIVPAGAMQERCELFIGGGTVVNLESLVNEIDALAELGVDTSRIFVSDRAHVVFPHHVRADREREAQRAAEAIGTTGRGIGPAYADKASRSGIVVADLCDDAVLAKQLRGSGQAVDATIQAARRVRPHVVDGVQYIHHALESGKRVLAEGAQGTLLDVGYGTYPYVTSSHTIAGGACTGLGVGPTTIGRVTGVAKAYCTRVGGGPFPSELHDEAGQKLRQAGAEFGTVTGRPRRCGWFDAVAAQYAARLNGLHAAALTKLDVLTGFDRIGIVTEYRIGDSSATFAKSSDRDLRVDVDYVEGWREDLRGIRRIADLPRAARAYVERIEAVLGVPIERVSVGPERSELALP